MPLEIRPNKIRRRREVRDIYNKLSKKYKSGAIMEFFRTNYFLDNYSVYKLLQQADDKAVVDPSMIYLIVMRDDFSL